jgi:branched-chain amino acid transport system permease protein
VYAHFLANVSPIVFSVDFSIQGLLMTTLGGLGTIVGPAVGAFIVVGVFESLRVAQAIRNVIYGALIVVLFIFLPQGVLPTLRDFLSKNKLTRP